MRADVEEHHVGATRRHEAVELGHLLGIVNLGPEGHSECPGVCGEPPPRANLVLPDHTELK